MRQTLGQGIGRIAHKKHHRGQHGQTRPHHRQHRSATMPPIRRTDANGGQDDHRKDHHQILHDQKAQRDLAMQGVNLAFVGQKLDDDDG